MVQKLWPKLKFLVPQTGKKMSTEFHSWSFTIIVVRFSLLFTLPVMICCLFFVKKKVHYMF